MTLDTKVMYMQLYYHPYAYYDIRLLCHRKSQSV